jgi:hypothetical protein
VPESAPRSTDLAELTVAVDELAAKLDLALAELGRTQAATTEAVGALAQRVGRAPADWYWQVYTDVLMDLSEVMGTDESATSSGEAQ